MRPMFVTAHPPLAARSGGIPCPPLAAIRRAVAYPAVPARPGEGGTAPAALRRSPRMSIQTPPASRGHRVREFVGAYRTLRNEHGQPVRLSTLALSEPRIAAAALAPLLEHEAVEILRRRVSLHPAPPARVACAVARHAVRHQRVAARRVRAGMPHAEDDGAAGGPQPSQRGSRQCGRCPAHRPPRACGGCDRHPAAGPRDRRQRRTLLQLPRGRSAPGTRRGALALLSPRRPSRRGWSGGPRARQVSRAARPLTGLPDLTGPPGRLASALTGWPACCDATIRSNTSKEIP